MANSPSLFIRSYSNIGATFWGERGEEKGGWRSAALRGEHTKKIVLEYNAEEHHLAEELHW